MEIRVLNKSLQHIAVLDNIESFIWTERYWAEGDFELYTPFDPGLLQWLQEDYYLIIPESKRVMIIDTIGIKTDPDSGDKLIVKGLSLESILRRRIILAQWSFEDLNLQDTLFGIIDQNIITTTGQPKRNIPNFVFSPSGDPAVTSLLWTATLDGNNIYAVVQTMMEQNNLGFKIVLNSSNQFSLSFYAGKDRSYGQSANPYVVFSPQFDNLIRSDYLQSNRFLKNYALIFGDPSSGAAHRVEALGSPPDYNPGGLDRREMFVDASDMSKFVEGTSIELDVDTYVLSLRQRGNEILSKNKQIRMFEGQVDLSTTYTYDTDFFLGDIVQMVDYYGNSAQARIIEMTFSENLSGKEIYPSLRTL